MRVLLVSGIWPPDIGGPASHAPDVADFLSSNGHTVEVVTTAEAHPAVRAYPVYWVSRALPKGVIHVISDIHGDDTKLRHVINNASGTLRPLIEQLFDK